jgi:uncharacterized phage protein (predicted DNA packaging)
MELTDIKEYLRVDHDDEDVLLMSLLAAAESYIKQQTGKTKVVVNEVEVAISTDELYKLCVKLMVAHWYENRAVQSPTNLTNLDYSVQALVNHITLCGDYK